MKAKITIEGVREAQSAFRSLPRDVQRESAALVKAIASDVASAVQGAASTPAEVKAASTIRAQRMSVSGGGNTPAGLMFFGTEFGGRGRSATMQFRSHKGTTGYFMYPTVRAMSAEIRKRWDDLVADAVSKAES